MMPFTSKGGIFLPHFILSGNALKTMPSGVPLRWFQIQSYWQWRLTLSDGYSDYPPLKKQADKQEWGWLWPRFPAKEIEACEGTTSLIHLPSLNPPGMQRACHTLDEINASVCWHSDISPGAILTHHQGAWQPQCIRAVAKEARRTSWKDR